MLKVCVIGCGNMPQALLSQTIGYEFSTYTPSRSKAIILAKQLNGKVLEDLDNLDDFDIFLLACKPQQFLSLAAEIKGRIPRESTVISMLAGTKFESLKTELSHNKIIRIMPNITAKVGKGSILVFPVLDKQTREPLAFLESTSKLYEIDSEVNFDKLMLITGSGPAYMFYFIRSLERYLNSQGLDSGYFLNAIQDTFSGAIDLMKHETELSTTDFIERVASKGGVTEEALAYFRQMDFDAMVAGAINNGVNKSKVLEKKTSN